MLLRGRVIHSYTAKLERVFHPRSFVIRDGYGWYPKVERDIRRHEETLRTHARITPPSRARFEGVSHAHAWHVRYTDVEMPRRFCNMLLFGSSEYLRDRFLPLNHCRGPYRYWQPAGEIGGISGISDLSGIRICSGESIPLERVGLNSFLVSSFQLRGPVHARGAWLSHRMGMSRSRVAWSRASRAYVV